MKVMLLKVTDLQKNPDNPFPQLDPKTFSKLVESIKENGILTPFAVVKEGDKYTILDGNNRYDAVLQIGGIEEVPCIVVSPEDAINYTFDPNIYRRFLPNNVIQLYEHQKHNKESEIIINHLNAEVQLLIAKGTISKKEAIKLSKIPWGKIKEVFTQLYSKDSTKKEDADYQNQIVQQLKQQIENLRTELKEKECVITDYEKQLTHIKNSIDSNTDKITELEEKIKKYKDEKKKIEKTMEELKTALTEKEYIIEALKHQLETETSSKGKEEIDMYIIENTLSSIEGSIETIEKIIENYYVNPQNEERILIRIKSITERLSNINNILNTNSTEADISEEHRIQQIK